MTDPPFLNQVFANLHLLTEGEFLVFYQLYHLSLVISVLSLPIPGLSLAIPDLSLTIRGLSLLVPSLA